MIRGIEPDYAKKQVRAFGEMVEVPREIRENAFRARLGVSGYGLSGV
jgi:hypothetical protein